MSGEFRKIYSETYIKIVMAILLVFAILMPIMALQAYDTYESAESENLIKGKDAVRLEQERYKKTKGEVSLAKINKVLKDYQSVKSEDSAIMLTDLKYPGLSDLLFSAYQPGNLSQNINLYQLKNANDFYHQNAAQNKALIKASGNNYSPWEKRQIIERSKLMDTPYQLDYSQHWVIAYTALSVLFLILAISAIIIGTRVFSYEKEKNMDLILSTVSEHNLHKIGRNKVFALCSFLTVQFLLCVILFTVAFFSSIGFSAWSSQIQIEYFNSIYPLTFGEAYLLLILAGWFCILAIGVMVSTINALIQKAALSLIVGGMLVFTPLIIPKLGSFPVIIKKLFQLQPVNGLLTEKCLVSLQLYRVGFVDVVTTTAILLYSCLLLALCLIIAPRLFRVRINKA